MNNTIEKYYQQYLKNHRTLNMDFYEFLSEKLSCSERKALRSIKKWKEQKLINII